MDRGALTVSRHYDSRNLTEGEGGALGPQWSVSLAQLASLEVLPDSSVMLIGPSGLTHFTLKEGKYEPPTGDENLELNYNKEYGTSKIAAYVLKNSTQNTSAIFTLPEGAKAWMPTVSVGKDATEITTDEYKTVKMSSGGTIVQPTLELGHTRAQTARSPLLNGDVAPEFAYDETTTATGEAESEWNGYDIV